MSLERPDASPIEREPRLNALHVMLCHFNEARSEAGGWGGSGGHHTSRINVFDENTWTREYVELERVLDELRTMAQGLRPMISKGVSSSIAWWNLRERYLNAQVVQREVHVRKTKSGNLEPVQLPRNMEVVSRQTNLHGRTSSMLVRVWDHGVDDEIVVAALRWVSHEFKGRPAVYGETS